MKNKPIYYGVILFLQLSFTLPNSINAYSLRQFSSKNGLSNSAILSICQDNHGFMWFGSCDGLNMYDGLNMQVYKPTDGTNNLSGNLIENIIEAEEGVLWVQTNYGLDRFDKRNKTIKSFKEFNSRNFSAVSTDNDIYIINEDNCIWYFNPHTESFDRIEVDNLSFYSILDVLIDKNNILWIFTNDRKSRGFSIEKSKGEVRLAKELLLAHDEELLYCFHEHNLVYFVDQTHCLYEYDLSTRKKYHIYDLHQEIRELGEISSIIKHHDDYYIGFKTSGLLRLKHTPEQKTSFIINEIDIKTGIFCLVKDRFQDVIWVGTDGQGVYMYFIDTFSIQTTLFNHLAHPINNPVRALFLDRNRTLWIGTKGDGILKINNYNLPGTNKGNASEHLTSANSMLNNNSVYAFAASKKNIVWIGNEDGLNYFSYRDNTIKKINFEADGHRIKYVHSICELNDSTLWIATVGDGAIKATLSGTSDVPSITNVKRFTVNGGIRSSNYFFTIYKENDSIIWFGNRGYGAYKMNTHKEEFEVYRFDKDDTNQTLNDIFSILKNEEGYWFGTSYGLAHLHGNEKKVFNETNGFPNNTIHSILEDKHANLWLSTNQGVIKFNIKQNTFQTYKQQNELGVTEFSDGAFYKDPTTGVLLFGGINGFISITENEYAQKEYSPPIQFSNLSIFGEDYNIYDFLKKSGNKEVLELDYSQNFFSVSFTAIDYIHGNDYTYLYKLDELSDNWIANGSSNTATFTNISPGLYSLSVKYRNNITGKESPVYALSVRIFPPWYKTRLAYTVYFLLCAALLFFIARLTIKWYKMKRDSMIEKLNQQQKEEVYESKLRFFTNITHELSTPLTLIYGPCEKIISYRNADPYVTKYATLIQHNAEKLNALIQELIEFRRLETGNKMLEIKTLHVSELARNIAHAFMELSESRGIEYQLQIEDNIYRQSDAGGLNKIITNLLSNAFKYTSGKGIVRLEVFVQDENLNIIVSNTGKGIKKENLPGIFDRYKILDDFEIQSKKGVSSRNGLGLAICHSMVHMLEGAIEVTSTPNEFTIFSVQLPQLTVVGDADSTDSESFIPQEETAYTSVETAITLDSSLPEFDKSKATVMIIDDDPSMLWFVTEIFIEKYNVVPINDAKEVLAYLKVNQPHLIISDIMMPDIDGISLTKSIKSDKLLKHIPLILLSAKSDTEEQVRGIESGAEAYITKPFNVEYLEKVASRLIQRKEDLKEYYTSTLSSFELEDGSFMHKEDKAFFEQMMQVIDTHIANSDLSVELLSTSLGCSTRQVYRRLKKITDQTPNDIIREYRLNMVERLLTTTGLSVDEILYKAGFANRGYFFKTFSQKYGMTPKKYREEKKKEFEELNNI